MTQSDRLANGAAEKIEATLNLLPPRTVLRETAEPVYDMVHIEADGTVRERHVYDRGFVLAESWEWTPGKEASEVLRGKRLILLCGPALELQEIDGRGRRPGAVHWTARARSITHAQVLEHWTVDHVRSGVAGVLRAVRTRPQKILLRAATSLLQLRQQDPLLEAAHVIDDGRPLYTKTDTALQLVRQANEQAAREGRTRELWGDGGAVAMTRLCRLFPALRQAPGVDPWDPRAMVRFACGGAGHGEQLAARFVLRVWNSSNWEEFARTERIITHQTQHLPSFDMLEAVSVWGHDGNYEAMATWLNTPFWP